MDKIQNFFKSSGSSSSSSGVNPEDLPKENSVFMLTKYVPAGDEKKKNPFSDSATVRSCFQIQTKSLFEENAVVPNGCVLIRVHYSNINPSDLMFLQGRYPHKSQITPPPKLAGFEGCGTVVATGSSGGNLLMMGVKPGTRVGFFCNGGAWGKYIIVSAKQIVTLPAAEETSDGNAASKESSSLKPYTACLVNPLTVLSFVDIALSGGHKYIVHTAAASALGRMLIRECEANNIRCICVVRREEQVNLCRREGAQLIVNTSEAGYEDKLKEMCSDYKCRLAFDAIAGDTTAMLIRCLPDEATVHVYGCLSEKNMDDLDVSEMLFRGKTVTGFHLNRYMAGRSIVKLWRWMRKVAANVGNGQLKSEYQERTFKLENMADALKQYTEHMSDGKVLIDMGAED
eukprot:Nk52_evm29s147 gene=Nk52_evmTU29s147